MYNEVNRQHEFAYLMYNELNRQHEARLPDVQWSK
jgi:hypothetical protein